MEKKMELRNVVYGVDIGGSLTKNLMMIEEGKKRVEKFSERNNSVLVHDGYVNTVDFVVDDTDFATKLDLSITIKKKPKGQYKIACTKIIDEINNTRWLMGTLANAVSINTTKIPLGMKMKFSQYYLNIIGSMVADMQENGIYNANVVLGVLLPARQYFNLEKEMIPEILEGEIQVINNITGETFNIVVEELTVNPEAVVAFNTCFIKNGKVTELGQDLISKFNIAIDIGENTTDIAGIREGKPDPLTFDSFEFAGGLLLQYLEREISREFEGYIPTDDELKMIISTGYINLGAQKVWAGDSINAANKEFAHKLFTTFTQRYLLSKNLKLQQIASFMFIGGGSVEIPKITSVGQHFMALIKEQSKYTMSFSPENIRLANINGLADLLRVKANDKFVGNKKAVK